MRISLELGFYSNILEKEITNPQPPSRRIYNYYKLLWSGCGTVRTESPTVVGSMNDCNRVAMEVIFCLGILKWMLLIWGFQSSAQRVALSFDMLYSCLMLRPLNLLPSDGLLIAFLHVLRPKNWRDAAGRHIFTQQSGYSLYSLLTTVLVMDWILCEELPDLWSCPVRVMKAYSLTRFLTLVPCGRRWLASRSDRFTLVDIEWYLG